MSDRVYVLIEVVEGKSAQVVRMLKDKHGVVIADVLEYPGELMMVVEAPERQRLAELTIQALISVEAMTGEVRLLPVKNGRDTDVITKSFPARELVKAGKRYSK